MNLWRIELTLKLRPEDHNPTLFLHFILSAAYFIGKAVL